MLILNNNKKVKNQKLRLIQFAKFIKYIFDFKKSEYYSYIIINHNWNFGINYNKTY